MSKSYYIDHRAHRKAYVLYYGDIPIDEFGRSYEIHHKNGDHNDNSKDNLIALNIQEHYNIHYAQGDYGACWYISKRMEMTPQEISELASLMNKKRVDEGTHNFLDGTAAKKSALERIANGNHQFLRKDFCSDRNKKLMASGKSPILQMKTCPYCNKTMNKLNYGRHHGEKCKMKEIEI